MNQYVRNELMKLALLVVLQVATFVQLIFSV